MIELAQFKGILIMRNLRWNRIFNASGRSLIVALDHIPSGFMQGWEYPETTLQKILAGQPDAIMTTFGILKQFAPFFAGRVGTILRLDGGPTYLLEDWPNCNHWGAFYSVSDAINVGADGVIVSLLLGSQVEMECMQFMARVAGDCLKYGLPCIFEALPVEGLAIKDKLDPQMIAFASRLAAELGADCVKTYYSGDSESFKLVTSRCPVPVLIAGGPKLDTEQQLFEVVTGMLAGGGQGVFIGRNIWQHPDPTTLLQTLKLLIHSDMLTEEATQTSI
jgi:DhnA family fructose-bisphosphate aldolase class Ia